MKRTDINKVLIIGSGPIVIGQACEFDYSGTQACKALRSLGYEIVLVNSNPATIMTDPEMADRTYKEKFTFKNKKYSAEDKYYLVIKNYDDSFAEEERIPFIIDILFSNKFNF